MLYYTSHRHNISQQAPPRSTRACNCVSYFIIILVLPQWFMASLYANIILLFHSSGAATTARILSGKEVYLLYMCTNNVCREKTTPTAYRYTNEYANMYINIIMYIFYNI